MKKAHIQTALNDMAHEEYEDDDKKGCSCKHCSCDCDECRG